MAYILLIDDDNTVLNRVQPALNHEGYRVDHAAPGTQAIRKMLIEEPDLVILGIDPPEDGWQFCHQLLTFLENPLLLLLSTDHERDRIKGLKLGAGDCMAKPVPLGELLARVGALLRRSESTFVDGALVVDLTHREVKLGDEPVALTPTEFLVLSCLVQHVGEVVPHKRLVTQVWGPDRPNSQDLLRPYVHHLRQKLEPDPGRPRRIVTRLREGYMLQRIGG
jgi:two-component system KDP operon response regulator KdpE